MALDSKHPAYVQLRPDWDVMRDTYNGERAVKEKGSTYLPPTSGQIADGLLATQPGAQAYAAYLIRAVFHNFVEEAVSSTIGVMHHKPPTIKLPEKMKAYLEAATVTGENLYQLLRRINTEQLKTGRFGLFLDLPATPIQGSVLPYIATYEAENIINWDDGGVDELTSQKLNLVVLNESEQVRNSDFEWTNKDKYRVLSLGAISENEPQGTYRQAVFVEKNFVETDLAAPSIQGRTLDEIPFVFINSRDIVPTPEKPPFIGLASLSLAIYRGEADYRQALFMQGQDTLVIIGGQDDDEKIRIGANASIKVPSGGDAKFIGVNSQGLTEMEKALENDKSRAAQMSGQLLDTVSREKESGDALQTRVAAKSASMNSIALSGAAALEKLLKMAATWIGANPDEVSVLPNLDFVDHSMGAKELKEFMEAKILGAPLSTKSLHSYMVRRGLTDLEFEQEIEQITNEIKLGIGLPEEEDEPTNNAGV